MATKLNYTRTINPLQFEALEPKRFEDLVRQLLYDFRIWRQLEATGRSGSDDGFDARGWEVVPHSDEPGPPASDDREPEDGSRVEGASVGLDEDRVWLVQCKRETSIGPAKLVAYLRDIREEEKRVLYGVILAAPANFSKRTRDEFRKWCAESGIAECYLWGRAELEDQLFQPKNDNLLFAYFGLSLVIRRRSQQAQLRARTTIKRKLKRILDRGPSAILIRDASDESYPYVGDRKDFPWWVCNGAKLTFRGLEISLHRYHAYIDEDGKHWDAADLQVPNPPSIYNDPWRGVEREERLKDAGGRNALSSFWFELPDDNKAWVEVSGVIALDDVLEVDEIGDDITEYPHVFVRTKPSNIAPASGQYGEVVGTRQWNPPRIEPKASLRIEKFPSKYRSQPNVREAEGED